ncbi:MAG: glycosyltransferase [Planctomycetota bacterium]
MATAVSIVMTVKNDARGCAQTLESLLAQTRPAAEILVVDGGSTDNTIETIGQFAAEHPAVRFLDAPGANIAQGRNVGIAAAAHEVVALTDAGCRAAEDWLAGLVEPFEGDPAVEFVGGFYRIAPDSLLEEVVGLATMRGQLDPVDAATFNPSARSMALTKSAWRKAGGFPEWLRFSEDTLFDERMRRLEVGYRFVPEAVVHWRPRTSLRSIGKQFYDYGTGRGHTQIDARSFAYNLRNVAVVAALIAIGFLVPVVWALAATAVVYFYVWTFHGKALRIARRTRRVAAYPLSFVVLWTVLVANLIGYLVGSWQRIRCRGTIPMQMDEYLAGTSPAIS